jgi:hypothetical protein
MANLSYHSYYSINEEKPEMIGFTNFGPTFLGGCGEHEPIDMVQLISINILPACFQKKNEESKEKKCHS